MKKEGINKIIATLILMMIAGVTGYIANQAFENAIKDSNDAYETKISNLESEVKLLRNLNSLYKKQIDSCTNQKVNSDNIKSTKSNNVSFTVDGKPLDFEEVLDYSNNLLYERNKYRTLVNGINQNYGITYYEKDGKYIIKEVPNGKIFMLKKEVNVLKGLLSEIEKKMNSKIDYNINDSVIKFKTTPLK